MKKRPDGRYQKRITLPNGKTKLLYSSANTEREAIKDFNRQMLELEETRQRSLNFDSVADAWSKERFPTLQNNSLKQYKPCKREAVVFFGNIPIVDITAIQIKSYLDMLGNKGYSKKTIKERYAVLKQIFVFAQEAEYIEKNPCFTVKLKNPKDAITPKREAATAEEINIITNLSTDVPFGFFVKFLLYTGCRRGEALALTSADIDFNNQTININKTVEWIGNKPQIKPQPKTYAGNRDIPIPDVLICELRSRAKQKYIFPNSRGDLIENSRLTLDWNKLRKTTGIKCTPHQLRHAYATMLFDAGIDVKTAQRWLGHADIKTTLDIYTHLSEKRQELSVEKWRNYLKCNNL